MSVPDYYGICRLCLSVDSQNLRHFLDEPAILQGIQTYLNMRIYSDDDFPKQICKTCIQKVHDVIDFLQKTAANAKLLENHLSESRLKLNQFYCSLKNKKELEAKKKISANIDNACILINDQFSTDDLSNDSVNTNIDKEIVKNEEPIQSNINQPNVIDKKKPYNNTPLIAAPEEDKAEILQRGLRVLKDDDPPHTPDKIQDGNKPNSSIENEYNYKCLTCFQLFDSRKQLLGHYNTKHKPKIYNEGYTMIKVKDNIEYECNKCHKIFQTKKTVRRHVRDYVDGPNDFFLCKICGRTYLTASEIVRHGRAHDGPRINCGQRGCSYSTPYLGALAQHEKRHKTDGYKYKCEECDKGFQVKTWYLQHQNIHKGLKPFVCDICEASFHMDRYLTAHKSSVHPLSSDIKRYVCPHCFFPCDSRKAYTDHLKQEHDIKTSFLCDVCGKTQTSAELLKLHQRVHQGVRPYECTVCDKTFTKKFNLQLHERTHTGEKSFGCDQCGRLYTQKSALIRHNNRHHTPEDIKCEKCSKSFATPSQLLTHQNVCS